MTNNNLILNKRYPVQDFIYFFHSLFLTNSVNYITTEFEKEIKSYLDKIALQICKEYDSIPVYTNTNYDIMNIEISSNNLDISINKASRIYEQIYNEKVQNLKEAKEFLDKVSFLFTDTQQEIVFSEDSVRIVACYYNQKFYIDYDYGYFDSVFVTRTTSNSIIAIESNISELEDVLLQSTQKINVDISVA